MGPSGPRRLRQLVADHEDDLAEAAVPGVEVEARSDLRQHVVECLQDLLQHEHDTPIRWLNGLVVSALGIRAR